MLSQRELVPSLPRELLDNIFHNVDIETVLSLRLVCTPPLFTSSLPSQRLLCKTCKTFYAITTSLWLYFARECCSKPENPRSEEPLEDYTSEELRHWVLRRYRAEQVWKPSSISNLHVRKTEIKILQPVILPGGRWFLSMNGWGDIMVVDMDRPQLEPKLLVKVSCDTEGAETEDRPGQFTVWVDPHAPHLAFRIALVIGESPRLSMHAEVRSHIFQARLQGHGDNATLIAEPFRQFGGVLPGSAKLGVVNGQYFIQIKENPRAWPAAGEIDFDMYVFDCEKKVSMRVRLCGFDYPLLFDIFIPSDDKVAIIGIQSIYIFSIPTPSATPGSEWHPIHTVSVAWAPPFTQRSDPYIGETSTTIMYLLGKEIMAFEVPHNLREKENLTHIAEFPGQFRLWRTVGLFDAINYHPQAGSVRCFLTSLSYPWDPPSGEGPKSDRVSIREIQVPSDPLNPPGARLSAHSFHRDIGRLVMIPKTQDLLYVYDLIPVGGLKVVDDGTR